MYYLCTRNSKERVFGGVWRSLSGEQVLTIRELFVSLFVEVAGSSGYDTIYNRCLCDLDASIYN